MASLFGTTKRPTFRYSRIVYNGITLDFEDPTQRADPQDVPVASSNISQSGVREVLFDRMERAVAVLTPMMDASGADALWRFIEEWGGQGEQFEFYVDTTLRAFWGFEQHGVDNNRENAIVVGSANLPLTNDTGTALSYVALSEGHGVTVPSSNALRASLVSASNSFVGTEGGTCVIFFKPDWAFADSAEHVIWDMVVDGALGANRLRLVKRADNLLHFVYIGSNGGDTIIEATSLGWSANSEHTVMVQWGALADLKMKVDGTLYTTKKYTTPANAVLAGGGTICGTVTGVPSGSETTINASPTRLTLGVDDLVLGGRSTGSIGLFAIYRAVYDLPTILATYRQPFRDYYPRAELVDASFSPTRVTSGRELYTFALKIRDGA